MSQFTSSLFKSILILSLTFIPYVLLAEDGGDDDICEDVKLELKVSKKIDLIDKYGMSCREDSVGIAESAASENCKKLECIKKLGTPLLQK